MKRIIYIPVAAGVLAFGGIVLANSNQEDVSGTTRVVPTEVEKTEKTSLSSRGQDELIGFERASAIALELAEGQVTYIELSEDDGRKEYEVEIRNEEHEYDFEIDAVTGEVLEQDRERIKNKAADSSKTNNESNKEMNRDTDDKDRTAEVKISATQVSDIARRETGGGAVKEIELDSDDGLRYYEVEIIDGNTKYELEIDAANGNVLKFEQDDDD